MNLTTEDQRLLEELCQAHQVSFDKIVRLLDTVREYEFKERRTGVYDALKEIIKTGRVESCNSPNWLSRIINLFSLQLKSVFRSVPMAKAFF